MDDCNGATGTWPGRKMSVQIPLWTIVTGGRIRHATIDSSSDSSMDDCNHKLQLRGGVLLARSDSSMDDCNNPFIVSVKTYYKVQIPLWTIVT